jgi:LPXTG-motif cell wall-anchored protein
MKVTQMKRWVVGGAVGAVMLFGGHAAATDYPPSDTTATTVAVGAVSGLVSPSAAAPAAAPAVDSQLAATGSDSDTTLKLAGGALVAGAGLLVAAKLRRRPAAA